MGRLKEGGCEEIILVGGAHNLEEVCAQFPDLQTIEQEQLELGMRGALLSALPHCGSEPVMVVGGNDVIDPSAYQSLIQSGSNAILAQRVDRYFPGGYLSVEGNTITGIIEKPGEGNEPSDLVNIVAHVHRDPQALLAALQDVDESRDDGYEQALAKLFATHEYKVVINGSGSAMNPSEARGLWQAVKYPWHLLQLLPVFLSEITEQRIDPGAQVHPTAIVNGNVIIESGVKVMPHAVVRGPCYIGSGSIVGNNALVRDASVGRNCVVGYNSEVKSSVLHSDVWTHSTYIGDSCIGHNVSFGAGTVTGNLRLDEKEIESVVKGERVNTQLNKFGTVIGDHCRLGIHVSMNPGIKIGSGTFVSSKVLVDQDVPDGSFVTMKNGEFDVRENRIKIGSASEREGFKRKI